MLPDRDLYEAYYQDERGYYIDRMSRYEAGDRFFFNSYALVFGLPWLLYRKLYIPALIFFLLDLCIVLIPTITGWLDENFATSLYPSALSMERGGIILLALTLPFVADRIYFAQARKKVNFAINKFHNREDMVAYLQRRGGASLLAPAVVIGIYILAVICLQLYISLIVRS